MSFFDRLSQVARAEVNHRLKRKAPKDAAVDAREARSGTVTPTARIVNDVAGALRVLEIPATPAPTLDVVRARYLELARRMHPKTRSENADEAHAAHVVQEALVDALEILEANLLPLSSARR